MLRENLSIGAPISGRSGVSFYEMLTGKRAFEGDDATKIFEAVATGEPDRNLVPLPFRRMIRKCLEKDPRGRLRDIGDIWDLV